MSTVAPASSCALPVRPADRMSVVGLAALLAVLNLAVLAGQISGRTVSRRTTELVWSTPGAEVHEAASAQPKAPSNPARTFWAGRLALTTGLAVIVLSTLLHAIRRSGVHGW